MPFIHDSHYDDRSQENLFIMVYYLYALSTIYPGVINYYRLIFKWYDTK